MKPNWHYYEAHINLGDMCNELLEILPTVLEVLKFKTTDIVNVPVEGLEQEDFHTIITTTSNNLKDIIDRVRDSVEILTSIGFTVNRYKIESTIIDSKYDDKFQLL